MKTLSTHNLSASTYEQVFSLAYLAVRVNLLLAVSCSPLLFALAIVDDPLASWPFFLVLSTVCAPALATVCEVFREFTEEGDAGVLRALSRTWRRCWRRATAVWVATGFALTIVVVDLGVVLGTSLAGALVPMLVTLGVTAAAVGTAVMVLIVEAPALPLRQACAAAAWLSARRWYLALLNQVVLVVLVAAVMLQPAMGVLLATAPLLYVVWANTRFLLQPALAAHHGHREASA